MDRVLRQWAEVRPDLDVSAMGVIGRLSRLTRAFERALQQNFASHGLQPGEFDLLATLYRSGSRRGLTAGELAGSSMVTAGAITNRLDRLVAKDLITRDLDPENRRSVRVLLTDEGRRVLEQALIDHLAVEEDLLGALDEDDRAQLRALLRHLLADAESSPR